MANPYAHTNATTGGGNGAWDESTTNTTSVALPTMSVLNTFTHTYNITLANLQDLCDYLWNFWKSLDKTFTKAEDALIALFMLPIASSSISKSGTNNDPYYVTLGYKETPYQAKLITKAITIDCGTVTIKEYSGSFLDYDENTQISLYIPYVGTVQLDTAAVMNKEVNIKFNVDIYTGNFVANVFVGDITPVGGSTPAKTLKYSYNGNCAYQIATSSINYSDMILGAVSAAIKVGTAIVGLMA